MPVDLSVTGKGNRQNTPCPRDRNTEKAHLGLHPLGDRGVKYESNLQEVPEICSKNGSVRNLVNPKSYFGQRCR